MTGLRYVYAVCRPFGAPLQAQLAGVAGDPPRVLTHHGLVAVVSHVPEADFAEEPFRAHLEDLDWLTTVARAHQGVIDALTTVTTPLPLRLGTVFRDDSGVRTMMEAREESFLRTLDRLAGRVEWGVKVFVEVEQTPDPAAAPPRASPPRAGTTCANGAGRRNRTTTCGSGPRLSRPTCTRRFPAMPRIPGCTRRRIPRSPAPRGAMC